MDTSQTLPPPPPLPQHTTGLGPTRWWKHYDKQSQLQSKWSATRNIINTHGRMNGEILSDDLASRYDRCFQRTGPVFSEDRASIITPISKWLEAISIGLGEDKTGMTRITTGIILETYITRQHGYSCHEWANQFSVHSEKSPARPMLFYSTNYWQQFWVRFVV